MFNKKFERLQNQINAIIENTRKLDKETNKVIMKLIKENEEIKSKNDAIENILDKEISGIVEKLIKENEEFKLQMVDAHNKLDNLKRMYLIAQGKSSVERDENGNITKINDTNLFAI